MDLRRQLGVLRSWGLAIVIGTALAAVAAFALSSVMAKVYETDTRLLVGQALQSSSPDVDQFQTAQNLAATYGEIATSDRVLVPVMEEVGITDETIETFADRVTVVTSDANPFIDIVARGASPEEAAAIANGVAGQLLAISRAVTESEGEDPVIEFIDRDLGAIARQIEEIRGTIDGLVATSPRTAAQQARLETLEARLISLRETYRAFLQYASAPSSNRLTVIDPATPPISAASPRLALNVALGAILGMLAMIAAAFLWETLDDRVKSSEDVERVTELPTIGTITRMPGERGRKEFYRLATLLYPRSPAAEAFRALRTNLEFASLDQRLRSLVVTSSVPHEGKTVVAANLAVAFAQSGRRVVLVDADLRRPGVQEIFGLRNERGLTDLARSDELTVDDVAHPTEEPNLRVVTSGMLPANPAELLGSHRMETTLARIREAVDLVVIDTAPIGAVTDAAVLAANADATVFVIRGHRTSERVVQRARQALQAVNARVVGVVLNDVSGRSAEENPYYGAYVSDEPADPAAQEPGRSGRTAEGASRSATRGRTVDRTAPDAYGGRK